MGKLIDDFEAYRTKMNNRIMETANTNIKRFFCAGYHHLCRWRTQCKNKGNVGIGSFDGFALRRLY